MTRKVRPENIPPHAIAWACDELRRRDADCAAIRNYAEYERMKRTWEERQTASGISNHVRRAVMREAIRAAVEQREMQREAADKPWLRRAS